MGLNMIDISSYQAGIDLDAVFRQNPLDGVIVKATEGTCYVNPYCDKWVQWLIKHNKPWGFYHFIKGGDDPAVEANYYYKHCLNYFGHGVPVADWESTAVTQYGPTYLYSFLQEVYRLSGVKPLVYCNLSAIQSNKYGLQAVAGRGYKLWLAQYASSNDQLGFNPNPWQNGSVYPFTEITMHQYTDHGLLAGYGAVYYTPASDEYGVDPVKYEKVSSNYLDLDLFYGTVEDWNSLAGAKETAPEPDPPAETRDEIIAQIMSLLEKLR